MKKLKALFQSKIKFVSIALLMLICFSNAQGATITSAQTGNWSATSTWVGGVVPNSSADIITIASGHIVTVDVTATVASLTVTGSITNNSSLTVSTTFAGAGSLTNSATGVLNIGGTSTINTLTATAAGNTVNYSGAAQTACIVTTYDNLTLSGTLAKTFANAITVNGTLSMEGTATLTLTAGALTYGPSATLKYNTSTLRTATATEWPTSIVNLEIAGTGVITSPGAGNLAVTGTFTVNANASVTIQRQFTVTGASIISGTANWISSSGTTRAMTFNGNVTLNNTATWTEPASGNGSANTFVFASNFINNALSFSALSTATAGHTFSGTNKTISGSTITSFVNVAVTGTITNKNTLTVTTALTGGGTLTQWATGVLNIGGTNTITTLIATSLGNTVNYTGAAQTVKTGTYNNLTLSGTGSKTTSTVTVNGVLSMEGSATASANITYGANATLQYNTSATPRTSGTTEWPASFTATGGVIIKSGTITLNGAKTALPKLTISGGVLNLGGFTSTGCSVLILGTSGQTATGTYGFTGSGASNINATYFAGTGTVNVTNAIWTWTGSSSTEWNTAANWNPTSVPTNSSEVIIPSVANQPTITTTLGAAKNITIKSGVTLTNTGGLTLTSGILILENGALNASTINGAGTLTLGGNIILSSIGTGTNGVTISCPIALGANRTFFVSDDGTNADDLTLSGIVSGNTFTLTKDGTGTLLLSGANTYTGSTTISAGTLKLNNATALGTVAAGTTITSGAVLDLYGTDYSTAETLTINGTGIANWGSIINSSSSPATFSGLITLGSASSIIGGTGLISISNIGTISGATFGLTLGGAQGGTLTSILGTTSGTLTKQDAGTWTLSGANTFIGATTISAGILKLNNASALGTTAGSTSITSGASLDLNGINYSTSEPLTINGTGISNGGAIINSSSSTATFAGLITLGSASSIIGGTGLISISNIGTISGATFGLTLGGAQGGTLTSILGTTSGTLTKQDAGTWTVSGANTYTGVTTINGGTLSASTIVVSASASNLGNASSAVALSGGNLSYTGSTAAFTRGLTVSAAGGTLTNTSANVLTVSTGTIVTTTGGALTLTNTSTGGTTLSSAISGGGSVIVNNTSTGITILSSANTYSGGTTLTAGTLNINNAGSSGTSSSIGTGAFTLNGGTIDNSTGGAIVLSTNNAITLGGDFTFTGTQNLDLGTGTITMSADRIITSSANTLTLGGSLSASTYSLTKAGAGGLSFGANSISIKDFTISAGTLTSTSNTLSLTGNFTNNGTFTHNSGTLSFAGSLAQTLTGVTTFNNLTVNNAAGLTSTNNITVNGILTLTSANASATAGALSMGAYTLNMGATATTAGTGDVTGMVKRSTIAASTNYSFGNQFTVLNFSNTGTLPTDITVKIILTTSHSWKSDAINRYYDIIRTGGDVSNKVDIQLHYLASELNGVLENSNIDFFDYHVSNSSGHDHGHNTENTTDKWIGKSGLSLTYLFPTVFSDKYWTLAQSTIPNYTWIGATSNDWTLADNWSTGVPISTSDVVIPDATTTSFDPTLPASTTIKSMSLANGSVLNGGTGTILTLNGSNGSAWMNDNASFNYGTSKLVFTGTTATIGGTNTFYDVTINSGGITSVSTSGSSVNIKNALVVDGALNTNGFLTLKSTASATARISQSAGTITGNVNVEQYIPGNKRASRFLAHPFSSAINLSQLIDDIDITGNPDGINDATIKTVGPSFTSTLTNNPSSYWFNTEGANSASVNGGWVPFKSADGTGTNNTWGVGEGIRILIRGAKGEGLDANAYTPSSTTLTMTGTPNQGNSTSVTLSSLGSGSGQGFNLVGNPFACPVDFSAVVWSSTAAANINKTIYLRNPQSGAYTPQLLVSGNPKIIPAYTAVFVQATSGSPVLTFTEANKAGASNETVFKKNSYIANGLQLKASIDTVEYDVLNFAFGDTYKEEYERTNDANKLQNDLFDLYSISSDAKNLCTDMRPLNSNSVIPLGLRLTSGSKRIRITVYANTLENYLEAYLLDKNTQALTKLEEGNYYDLDVDATNTLSLGNNRLQVVFKQGTTGLSQVSKEPKIGLFPNPASTFIAISFPTKYVGEFNYTICNQLGEELCNGAIEPSFSNPNQINVENLAAGIYFIKVSNSQTTQTIKFIK
ncbi:MAG: hypothetical protein CFE21_12680 [Bacteroidetes bacterium B1(2017)]|nr:MAG: hypothetical protein CFE21_12680 [Bacteroidetes bacterium B1(2017)]